MKLIINTTITPHFCALFADNNDLLHLDMWQQNKKDADMIIDFFQKYIGADVKLSFLGGVAGPGGFSSLRVASGVLTACAIKYNLPIHSAMAERWLSQIADTDFLMPSFGNNVWLVKKGERTLTALQDLADNKNLIECKFLQAKQQQKLLGHTLSAYVFSEADIRKLLNTLLTAEPKADFIPAYSVPPVS